MKRIKTGDTVVVRAGKSKGHVGKVIKVNDDKVIVEGANLIKKHVKANPQVNQQGGIITKEAFLHVSNVSIYNQSSKKADKVGFKFLNKNEQTYKVRYLKSTGEVIDLI